MLSEAEIEEFLRRLLRRSQEIERGQEARLHQLAQAGAQELLVRLAAQGAEPLPWRAAEEVNQVTKLPTPPQEDPSGLFDPQRDISPG